MSLNSDQFSAKKCSNLFVSSDLKNNKSNLNQNLNQNDYADRCDRFDHSRFTTNKSTSSIHSDLNMILEQSKSDSLETSISEEENSFEYNAHEPLRYSKECLLKIREERAEFIRNNPPEIFKTHSNCFNGKYWDPVKYFNNQQRSSSSVFENKKQKRFKKNPSVSNKPLISTNPHETKNEADKMLLGLLKKNSEDTPKPVRNEGINILEMLQKKPTNNNSSNNILNKLLNQSSNSTTPPPAKYPPGALTVQEIESGQFSKNSRPQTPGQNFYPKVMTLEQLESIQLNNSINSTTPGMSANTSNNSQTDQLKKILKINANKTTDLKNEYAINQIQKIILLNSTYGYDYGQTIQNQHFNSLISKIIPALSLNGVNKSFIDTNNNHHNNNLIKWFS